MQNVSFINDLKLRASWGQSGNAPTDNYLYFRSYSAESGLAYMETPGAKPKNIELTNLKWEIIEQTNLGLSFFGFKNRMNVEFDIYN
ncbi:MAG: TonB-dependent receptor [Bacteroidales bacterium]|nr:TonB-dependent receptor [Bacteroidales bacterium]